MYYVMVNHQKQTNESNENSVIIFKKKTISKTEKKIHITTIYNK